jgi:hypothetical protein
MKKLITNPKLLLIDSSFLCFWIWFYFADGRTKQRSLLMSNLELTIIAMSFLVSLIQVVPIYKRRNERIED